jgi:hypothetical protein
MAVIYSTKLSLVCEACSQAGFEQRAKRPFSFVGITYTSARRGKMDADKEIFLYVT